MPTLLEFQGIHKRFPGVEALKGISFGVEENSVHALVGENGAGKSTLIKVCCGIARRDAGEIRWKGKPVDARSPLEAGRLGIGVVHQQFPQCLNLTIAQNIYLAELCRTTIKPLVWRERNARAHDLLHQFGLDAAPETRLGELSIGERQVVEICKAVTMNAELIIMDEPTSSLALRELESFFDLIKRLRQHGMTMIYVSHRLDEVFRIADRITVLRDGVEVFTGNRSEVSPSEVATLMVGCEFQEVERRPPPERKRLEEPLLAIEELSVGESLRDISLEVFPGEIVGLAGLQGSGTSELMKSLFGLLRRNAGHVMMRGEEVRLRNPLEAIAAGLAYMPADRYTEGLNTIMSVGENIALAVLQELSRRGVMGRTPIRRIGEEYIDKLDIKARSVWQQVEYLSGGNQQKVGLAKWLATEPSLLLLDDPTRGVDVGAKAEIHRILRNIIGEGRACVMTSSELPELISFTDRIITMYKGQINGYFRSDQVSQEKIMHAISGADEAAEGRMGKEAEDAK